MGGTGSIATTFSFTQQWRRLQFSTKSQLAFLEDFYLLVNDGIPPNRAIEMMTRVSKGINKDVASSIAQKISEGQPLAEGMRSWFALNVTEIIRIGEEGGALAETIKSAITSLSQQSGTWGAFISAVSYPLVVIILACAIIVYLDNSVFSQFTTIKPIEEWPQAGRDLLAIANIIKHWWWMVLAGLGATAFALRWLMKNYVGELRPTLDTFPPFSLYRQFAAATLLQTLGLLVENGVVFKSALKVMQHQANPYLLSHLMTMEHLLSMGKGNIADVLSTGLVDETDVLRLRVMAEVKGFEHGLIRMGLRGAEKATKTLRLIGRMLGGLFLMVGAGLILIIVRGIYLTGMAMGGG